MVTVAVTGSSGLVGRRLLAALDMDPAVERVLGLDQRGALGTVGRKLEVRQVDVRDVRIDRHLQDVDVLVHLAARLDGRPDHEARSVNVDGARNVCNAAAVAGVARIVYLSSGTVYGAHPDNDVPLDEEAPLRGNPDVGPVEHKLAVERWLQPWRELNPEISVAVLRPSLVAGPGVQNLVSRLFEQPRLMAVRGHRPPLQFVHVNDLAAAIIHAIHAELDGAYNVSAEGWLSFDEVTAVAGRKVIWVPEEVAFTFTERLWRLGLSELPPGMLHYVMHPWVLSVDRLVASGWRPAHTNRDALAELVSEHRDWVALGPRRTHRATVRNWAAGAAGTIGLLAALGVARRRRGRIG